MNSIEGGDCLVLSENTLCLGISQRTTPQAIELMANRLIGEHSDIQRILAVDIPKSRAFIQAHSVGKIFGKKKTAKSGKEGA